MSQPESNFIADSERALKGVLDGKPVFSLAEVERYITSKVKGAAPSRPVRQRWSALKP